MNSAYIPSQPGTNLLVPFAMDEFLERLLELTGLERIVQHEQCVDNDLLPHEPILEPVEWNNLVSWPFSGLRSGPREPKETKHVACETETQKLARSIGYVCEILLLEEGVTSYEIN